MERTVIEKFKVSLKKNEKSIMIINASSKRNTWILHILLGYN